MAALQAGYAWIALSAYLPMVYRKACKLLYYKGLLGLLEVELHEKPSSCLFTRVYGWVVKKRK